MAFDFSSLTSFLKTNPQTVFSQESVIGIDMGSSSVKIVQLRDVKGTPTLETYGELQLGPYEGIDIGRGTHLPPQKSIEALIDIMREAGATSKSVAYAISYGSSFTAVVPIPTLDQEKIGSMIPIEARKYIPISLNKISLEWFPLVLNKEERTTTTLLTAIYSEAKVRYESIMLGGNFRPLASEIEIFSSVRSVLSEKSGVVAIFDCGVSSTRMYIIKDGVVMKTHSVLLSGAEITQALSKDLSVEFKHAEELKREYGINGKNADPRIQKTIVALLERGLRELHTVMKRYEEGAQVTIDSVILSGGGALLEGVDTYIHDMFSKSVKIADPFSKIAYPAFLEDTLKEAGPAFAVAVGVALRAFQKE